MRLLVFWLRHLNTGKRWATYSMDEFPSLTTHFEILEDDLIIKLWSPGAHGLDALGGRRGIQNIFQRLRSHTRKRVSDFSSTNDTAAQFLRQRRPHVHRRNRSVGTRRRWSRYPNRRSARLRDEAGDDGVSGPGVRVVVYGGAAGGLTVQDHAFWIAAEFFDVIS